MLPGVAVVALLAGPVIAAWGAAKEWVAACKGGSAPLSNFDHSGPSIELMLLGNVATLVNQPLEYDPVACKIIGNDEADRALRPEHREGWAL